MKTRLLLLGSLVLLTLPAALALKDGGNRAYVQSGPDGVFYARCIPQDVEGSAGFTDIYRVEKERDVVVDHYEWYARHGVVLGWSPKAGKVAVLAIRKDPPAAPDQQAEVNFYLGGTLLKSWSTADLQRLGAEVGPSFFGGKRAEFQVKGCDQIPGTNDYVFVLQFGTNKTVSFDILTGQPFHP